MKRLSLVAFKFLIGAMAFALPRDSEAAVAFFDPSLGAPAKLSELRIYTNIVTKATDTAMKYYDVNSALWSDAAHKARWVILPPGKHVTYVDTTDKFDYPDSTIFVKLFRHDTIPGDTASRIYWETRLLVKAPGGGNNWHCFSYKWNKGATEATLVSASAGLDTVLFIKGSPHYRKWHFPTKQECYTCHRIGNKGRSVLGFYPAQLKRPSYYTNANKNQVTALFENGVFTGTQPTATLFRRFRGLHEPIPSGLSASERYKVIDTMARSYIASNCSGCHGNKGLEDGATGHAPVLNFDYYNFAPRMEFGYKATNQYGLDLPDEELFMGDTAVRPTARYKFLQTLEEWGVKTNAGSGFMMSRAPNSAFPAGVNPSPYLVVPGYPAYTTLIYRQAARRSAAVDSGDWFRKLGPLEQGDAQKWKPWLFKAKWGSTAWRDTLAAHSVNVNQIFTATQFASESEQMPPLATYLPDTAALKILAEWATNYYTLTAVPGETPVVSIHGSRIAMPNAMTPVIRNRQLVVPEGWTGKAVMTGIDGRATTLSSSGRGRYALPASIPSGMYFFRIGDRTFRTSVLR
jgi:hypothetical protein